MNLYTLNRYLFVFWLVVAVLTSIYGAYMVYETGFAQSKMYVFLPCVAWAFCLKAFFMKKKLTDRRPPEGE